jgi:hypothetical protein
MKQETNENSAFETFLYTLIGVVVFIGALIMFLVSVLGEWVILAIGAVAAIGIAALIFWIVTAFATWLWSWTGDKREDWADRRLQREVLAASTRTQLLLAEKSSALVYAQDGFLPVAYASVMDGSNNTRLLDLADKRIDTLRLPENVPNHLHIVTQSDTEQTLNQGANVPSVGGALGDLSFLLPGQSAKYKVLETKEGDRDDDE